MDHAYNNIIDYGVGAPGHGQDIVDEINVTEKKFIPMLMENLQFLCSKGYDEHAEMHITTQNEDISITKELKKHLSNITKKNGVIDQGKYKNVKVNGIGVIAIIMFNIMLMLTTKM